MKTILCINKDLFCKKLKNQIILTAALGAIAIVLNILLLLLRTDENHFYMYALIVVTDVLYTWFLIAFLELVILPKSRMLELFKGNITMHTGKILSVGENTTKMRKIDCYDILLDEGEARKLFVPDTLTLSAGDNVTVGAVSNIVVEVCYEQEDI